MVASFWLLSVANQSVWLSEDRVRVGQRLLMPEWIVFPPHVGGICDVRTACRDVSCLLLSMVAGVKGG